VSTALADPTPMAATRNRTRSIAMVFCCTIFGAAAQLLFKAGLKVMPHFSVAALLVNWPLLLGLACYGGSTVLLVLALREGELSLLYPVISLTYAWVTILSYFWLGESLNIFKVAGLATIISGVCLLGMKSKR
jgi:multidrug transporter EmrE-like cation transporter